MKLWNKTLLASALCLTLFGCDDASKVDNKLDKAKDNAEQMKDAAADKAQAIKKDADKQIDTLKSRRRRGRSPEGSGQRHQGGGGQESGCHRRAGESQEPMR